MWFSFTIISYLKRALFLAHLAQSAKVSFWDDPLSVVRRRRRRRPSCVVRRQQFT